MNKVNKVKEVKKVKKENRYRPPMDPATLTRRIKLAPEQLSDDITPADDAIVLAHLGIPRVDPARWSLTVGGMVRRERTFTLAELIQRPKREIEAFHECAGNPLMPRVPTRRISNLVWGGISLREILAECGGVKPEAKYVWSYGLDYGEFEGVYVDSYVKDLPLERLFAPEGEDIIIAYELNRKPLPPEHGFPARLLVPGFYGTNSVKWIYRIELAAERAPGLFTTRYYNDTLTDADGAVVSKPVWAVAPHSVIVWPPPNTNLRWGEEVEIWGRGWGDKELCRVEISFDGGQSFVAARLTSRRQWGWQRFWLRWRPARRGSFTLVVRATDSAGQTQPASGARNALHSVPITVT